MTWLKTLINVSSLCCCRISHFNVTSDESRRLSSPDEDSGSSAITVFSPMLEMSLSCSLSDVMFEHSVSTIVSTWGSFTLLTRGARLKIKHTHRILQYDQLAVVLLQKVWCSLDRVKESQPLNIIIIFSSLMLLCPSFQPHCPPPPRPLVSMKLCSHSTCPTDALRLSLLSQSPVPHSPSTPHSIYTSPPPPALSQIPNVAFVFQPPELEPEPEREP